LNDIENLWLDSSKCLPLKDAVKPITLVLGYEEFVLP